MTLSAADVLFDDLNLYNVTAAGEDYRSARVFVGFGRARIYVAEGGQAVLKRDEPYTAFHRGNKQVTIENGEVWTLMPAGGCGCGSPLKSITPMSDFLS